MTPQQAVIQMRERLDKNQVIEHLTSANEMMHEQVMTQRDEIARLTAELAKPKRQHRELIVAAAALEDEMKRAVITLNGKVRTLWSVFENGDYEERQCRNSWCDDLECGHVGIAVSDAELKAEYEAERRDD